MCGIGALMIAGTAVQAMGQIQSGLYAASAAKYRGKVADMNKSLEREAADDAIGLGQDEQRRLGREVASRVGSQEARLAANNVDLSVGSAARTVQDTRDLGAEESSAIAENVRRRVRDRQIGIWNLETEKIAAKSEAKQALIGTAFGVASTALGGATQYAKFKAGRG